jgi:hypothetical protein
MADSAKTSAGRPSSVLAAVLLLVLLAEAAVRLRYDAFIDGLVRVFPDRCSNVFSRRILDYERGLLKARGKDRPVVISGASTARRAFDRERLDAAFAAEGLSFHKLYINGARMAELRWGASRALRRPPELLVFMPDFGAFSEEIFRRRRLRHFLTPAALPDLWTTQGPRRLWANRAVLLDGMIGWASRYHRHRLAIRRILGLELRPEETERVFRPLDPRLLRDWPNTPAGRSAREDFSRYIEFTRSKGIDLVVFDAPIIPTPSYQASRCPPEYRRFLSEESRRLSFELYTQDDYGFLTVEDFRDPVHLTKAGARKFTDFVIEKLKRRSAEAA